ESVQQPVGADEVDTLFLRLLQQLLRELLLIDELSRHRIDHLGRVHHGLFLSVRPTQKHRKSDSPARGRSQRTLTGVRYSMRHSLQSPRLAYWRWAARYLYPA